ncbi:DUF4405 domain-containing protein [bacterium]|nr:MAG: DUF4405 domain-containing protein [bacterium]
MCKRKRQKIPAPRLDRETIRLTYRHYLFYDHLPAGDEYRILQNASYLAVVLFFILQIITGVLLIEAEGSIAGRIIAFLGGLSDVRQVHLFLLWFFITFTVVHVYMALTEEFQKFKLMMFGIAGEK